MSDDRIVNERDVEWDEESHGDSFLTRRKRLGTAAGGEELGCSLYELPAGKRPFPYHYHTANEEAIYVLSGEGTLRTPEGHSTVEPGDYVALPAGEEHARQLINDGDEPLRYLCLSTMRAPEITVYPDSGKIGAFAGRAPGPDVERELQAYLPLEAATDYWDGEGTDD